MDVDPTQAILLRPVIRASKGLIEQGHSTRAHFPDKEQKINDTNLRMGLIGRLALAAFLGMLIGLERELVGQPAGERTHALASLGAGAFGLISLLSFPAGIWAVGAIGLAIGAGLYLLGLVTALLVGVILALKRVLRIDKYLAQSRFSREASQAETQNRDISPDQW